MSQWNFHPSPGELIIYLLINFVSEIIVKIILERKRNNDVPVMTATTFLTTSALRD